MNQEVLTKLQDGIQDLAREEYAGHVLGRLLCQLAVVVQQAAGEAPGAPPGPPTRCRNGAQRATAEVDDYTALEAIHSLLDGMEWSGDTLDQVAQVLQKTGRPVRDVLD